MTITAIITFVALYCWLGFWQTEQLVFVDDFIMRRIANRSIKTFEVIRIDRWAFETTAFDFVSLSDASVSIQRYKWKILLRETICQETALRCRCITLPNQEVLDDPQIQN